MITVSKVLEFLAPVTRWFGSLHFPYTHKIVTGVDYYEAWKVLRPGDGILSRTRGEITNGIIPGFFKHAGMFARNSPEVIDELVVDMTSKGCCAKDLVSYLMCRDYFIVVRFKGFGAINAGRSATFALSMLGKVDYDFGFDAVESLKALLGVSKSDPKLYCFESLFYWWSKFFGKPIFTPKMELGVPKVTGNDFLDPNLFEIVYKSKSLEGIDFTK